MSKKVKDIEEALKVLKAHCVEWVTVNKIENSLWDMGVAFFDRTYCRVAYYDELQSVVSMSL